MIVAGCGSVNCRQFAGTWLVRSVAFRVAALIALWASSSACGWDRDGSPSKHACPFSVLGASGGGGLAIRRSILANPDARDRSRPVLASCRKTEFSPVSVGEWRILDRVN